MPRLDVAVIHRDGSAEIVNAARPATLVAFSDAHDGKLMPETMREIAWVVHRARAIEEPLEEWLETLEDVSADDEDVRLARRIIRGDEAARDRYLGIEAEDAESDPLEDPTEPTIEE